MVRARFLLAPLLVVLSVCLFSGISERYLAMANITNMIGQASPLILLAVGQSFVLASRGFDISVGATAALASTIAAIAVNMAGPAGLLAAPVIGLFVGSVNGVFVSRLKLQPIVATLSTFILTRAAALLASNDGQIIPIEHGSAYARLALDPVLGILPPAVIVALLSCVGAHLLFSATIAGRQMLMLGSNPEAVKLVGADPAAISCRAYQTCGLFAGLAGAMIAMRAGAGLPSDGGGMELQSIAAAVIGGTSLAGGIVSVLPIVLGALFIQTILTGLNLAAVSPFIAQTTVGVVIIASGVLEFAVQRISALQQKVRRTTT